MDSVLFITRYIKQDVFNIYLEEDYATWLLSLEKLENNKEIWSLVVKERVAKNEWQEVKLLILGADIIGRSKS